VDAQESTDDNDDDVDDDQLYTDLDPEERKLLRELDKASAVWIGNDLQRWLWYEGIKARRAQLQKKVKAQEQTLSNDLMELREALGELDNVIHIGLLDDVSGTITPAGWFVVALSLVANVALVYAFAQIVTSVWQTNWPPT
jgi:hypothetical protein